MELRSEGDHPEKKSRDNEVETNPRFERHETLHILMVPLPLESHVMCMFGLAQALVAVDDHVVVTFAYPARPYILQANRSWKDAGCDLAGRLRIEIVEDGLPRDGEAVTSFQQFAPMQRVYENQTKVLLEKLQREFSSHVSVDAKSLPLSCIMSDTMTPWMQDLADAAAIPYVGFWTSTAAAYSMSTQLPVLLANGTLPLRRDCWANPEKKWTASAPLVEGVPGLPPFPVTDLLGLMTLPEEITDPRLQFLLASVRRAKEQHCILIYSMYDLESQVFDALRDVGFTAYGVGPFLGGDLRSRSPSLELSRELNKCMRWLDAKPPCSVIYIALGTMVKLDPAELQSMARGLEDCKRPFLWVIPQSSIKDLPEGFQQRTIEQDCGHIVPWAAQRDVLRHRSVAVFISHCGWNSILECMWEGVPIVACPFFAEQRSNARWIVQRWRIGLEMERGDDGSFTREAVREVLQTLLSHELGSQIRERASRMKDVIQLGVKHGGSSHQSLIKFLGRLRLAAD